jgi:hypothetical protein
MRGQNAADEAQSDHAHLVLFEHDLFGSAGAQDRAWAACSGSSSNHHVRAQLARGGASGV